MRLSVDDKWTLEEAEVTIFTNGQYRETKQNLTQETVGRQTKQNMQQHITPQLWTMWYCKILQNVSLIWKTNSTKHQQNNERKTH